MDIMNEDYTSALKECKQVIKQCFTDYRIDEVFLSFNGGKDCTALLDITFNVIREMFPEHDKTKDLRVVYIRNSSPFLEIEKFVDHVESFYGINLSIVEGNIKSALENILKEDHRLRACLMGTRRTDPYSSHLQFMQETDENWPKVMRVFPLLNWSYHQIWTYILKNKVPYCDLYDKGYTSIGSTLNTLPNPSLQYEDVDGTTLYRPAFCLTDGTLERDGRAINNNQVNGHGNEINSVNIPS